MSNLSHDEARRLFGADLIDSEALRALLGGDLGDVPAVPFARDVAIAARESGCLLVFRPAALRDGAPITLAALAGLAAGRGDGLKAFAGDDPWFVDDATANADTVEPGWALIAKEPWRETLNQTYLRGEEALRARAGTLPWRRRRAPEIAFDVLAYAAARGTRLLADRWDWSSTQSHDGGLVNLGNFGDAGLDVLSYSKAVKHGALGICPTLIGSARS
jgi:hypothetical protein